MSNLRENPIELENKTNKINKTREIIKKGLQELEIKRINKIKELQEIELISLNPKLIIERMKENLEEFEIKILETEIENKTDALKQTEKIVRKQIWVIEKPKLYFKELQIKEIIKIIAENQSYCFKLPFSYLNIKNKIT